MRTPQSGRPRRKRAAVIVPVVLAAAAAVSVGAAAYSNHESDTSNDASATVTGTSVSATTGDELRPPVLTPPDVVNAPVPAPAASPSPSASPGRTGTLVPDEAGAFREVKIEIGRMSTFTDPTGLSQTSLPLKVTNTDSKIRSFDITVVARDGSGAEITDDTGTASNLAPGQAAEVRVLDLVNNAIAEALQSATFTVTEVFAY